MDASPNSAPDALPTRLTLDYVGPAGPGEAPVPGSGQTFSDQTFSGTYFPKMPDGRTSNTAIKTAKAIASR